MVCADLKAANSWVGIVGHGGRFCCLYCPRDLLNKEEPPSKTSSAKHRTYEKQKELYESVILKKFKGKRNVTSRFESEGVTHLPLFEIPSTRTYLGFYPPDSRFIK